MNKVRSLAAVAAVACLPVTLVHAEPDSQDAVIVTATRTAVTANETLAAVTVINREDIERSQAKTAVELLTGIAGLDSNVSGGYGKVTDFFVRGTNSDHVLVLVDGVRVGSATLGTYSWEFLPLDQIDRIEIVRGPRSSLYGADAIGGVVQIFTRRGKNGMSAGAAAGYGTYDSREYTANVSGASGGSHYSLVAGRFQTDGINARKPAPEFSGGPIYSEPDMDGYRNDSFSTRVGHRFVGGAEIEARLMHAQGNTEYDGSFINETDFIQNTMDVEWRFVPTDAWNVKLQAGRSRDETDNFKDGTYVSTFNTNRRLQSWQNDVTLAPRQMLTLGIDRQTDLVESSTAFNVTSRDNTGYFAQHQAGFGRHDLLVGLRRDDNEAFGTHDTGNLAWGYALAGERLRFVASYGTAFKAPTFNHLDYPGFGNPNLKPEESATYELGLRGREAWGRWDVRAHQTNIDNLIATLCDASFTTCTAQNITSARIRGLETEFKAALADWTTAIHLTLLDPRDLQNDKVLPRRARRSLRLDADRGFGNWNLGASLVTYDERFEYEYDLTTNAIVGATRVGGYGLVNLRARYDLGKYWFLRARADNIFDKEYETAATYNNPGRRYFVTLGYQGN